MKETIEEACKRYVAVLDRLPNANGRVQDTEGTPSWRILGALFGRFGQEEVGRTLKPLFAQVKQDTCR